MRQTNVFLNSCWWNYLNLKHEKEIDYLSPIVGSVLGWYLWLKKREGVYELILSDLKKRIGIEVSTFLVKYYPLPEEHIFDCFGTAEQVVRLSSFFDNDVIKHQGKKGGCACSQLNHSKEYIHRVKGFPKLQNRTKINPTLFTIGQIKLFIDNEQGKILKSKLVSQDHLIEYSWNGISFEHEGTLIEVVKPGNIDRSIPAWKLCWDLYDFLVKEVFAKMGVYPKNCERNSREGLIFFQEKGGDIRSSSSESVTRIIHSHFY